MRFYLVCNFFICYIWAGAQDTMPSTPLDTISENILLRANRYLIAGNLDSAEACAAELQQRTIVTGLQYYTFGMLDIRSQVLFYREQFSEAFELQDSALALRRAYFKKDNIDVMFSLNAIGGMMEQIGWPDSALVRFGQAERIGEKEGEAVPLFFRATLYNNIGNAHAARGNYELAERYYRRAMDIRRPFADNPTYRYASVLLNMGALYVETGRWGAARDYLEEAEAIYRLWNDNQESVDLITIWQNLGVIANEEQDWAKASMYFTKALDLGQRLAGGLYMEYPALEQNYAAVLLEQDSFEKAEACFRRALGFWEMVFGEHPNQVITWCNLGRLEEKRGEYAIAGLYYQKADTLARRLLPAQHPHRAYVFHCIGNLHYLRGDLKQARAFFMQQLYSLGLDEVRPKALESARIINLLFTGLVDLGKTHFREYHQTNDTTQLDAALRSFVLADSVLNRLLMVRTTFEEQKELQRDARTLTEWAIYAEIARNGPNCPTVFAWSERYRALHLYYKFREEAALRYAIDVPDSLISAWESLQFELYYAQNALSDMIPESAEFYAAQSHLAQLRRQLQDLRSQLSGFPNFYRFRFGATIINLKEAQNLLSPGEVMLQYLLADSAVFLLVMRQQDFVVKVLPIDFDLSATAQSMCNNIAIFPTVKNDSIQFNVSVQQYTETALGLYRRLIAPAQLHPGESLIIVPDGILWLLPFDALLEKQPANPRNFKSYAYLAKNHRISLAYSVNLLRETKRYTRQPTRTFIGISPFNRQAWSQWPQLTASALMTNRLREVFKGDALSHIQANRANVIDIIGNYQIVLFATHAHGGDEGFIVLAPDTTESFSSISPIDIYQLSISADLVILSACETGLGRIEPGEGLMSLGRAFTYAGARALICTLWVVDETSTTSLINDLGLLLAEGKAAHEALHSARLKWLRDCSAEGAHPWFWAGLIGLGELGAKMR